MSIFTKEKQGTLLFTISTVVVIIALLAVAACIGLDAYVRWSLNQNFSFMSGDELPALTLAAFGLLFGLTYLRMRKD
jgi:hypothetical protein